MPNYKKAKELTLKQIKGQSQYKMLVMLGMLLVFATSTGDITIGFLIIYPPICCL